MQYLGSYSEDDSGSPETSFFDFLQLQNLCAWWHPWEIFMEVSSVMLQIVHFV